MFARRGDVQAVIRAYKALYPEELVERYKKGERDFRGINLFRAELEKIFADRFAAGQNIYGPVGKAAPYARLGILINPMMRTTMTTPNAISNLFLIAILLPRSAKRQQIPGLYPGWGNLFSFPS